MATLAAVLFVVAWNMGEWFEIPGVVRLGKTDRAVWLVTFALTVLADLTVAVEVGHGAGCAALRLPRLRDDERSTVHARVHRGRADAQPAVQDVPPYVSILRIHGPFLFGTTDKLADVDGDLSTRCSRS